MDRANETATERRERYLRYAAEAQIAAFRCDAYINIAKSWTALAGDLLVAANDSVRAGSNRRQSDQTDRP